MNIHWYKGDIHELSPHFSTKEFTCPCLHPGCDLQVVSSELLDKLEQARTQFGKAIRVTSGYRCAAHQAELKAMGYETAIGVSPHQLGIAADIQPLDPTGLASLTLIVLEYFMAVGTGHTFLHVDTRADKVRRWSYNTR